ncbi:MAG: MotA/TolQ/ExbB proton channel family protein [Gammaproteobacteria bacterium]
MRNIRRILILFCLLTATAVMAEAPRTLDELLERVRKERTLDQQSFEKRENYFKKSRAKQAMLLKKAKTELNNEEKRSAKLRQAYDNYQSEIERQEDQLQYRAGSLAELHGVVRQISSDVDAVIDSSLISAQKENRDELIDQLANSKEMPAIEQLEELWLLVLDEMTESGKVATFKATVITSGGDEKEQDVTRVGVFNAVSGGHFLRYLPETEKLVEPGRQPSARFMSMALGLEQAKNKVVPFPIDPTRGAMLSLLVQIPDLKARIHQGGLVGYIIIAIAVIGLLMALERFIMLSITDRKVKKQLKSMKPGDNPLGRVIKVYNANPDVDTETLEYKLDEAILKEMPKLQRGLGALALLAAISPLLGLLGTVTGIIDTFQSITLYGTGDPRVMSGGISQALVTTVMGLLVAIPLLLIHSFLSSKSNRLIQTLDEKSLAFVALLAEINRLKNSA